MRSHSANMGYDLTYNDRSMECVYRYNPNELVVSLKLLVKLKEIDNTSHDYEIIIIYY